MPQFNVADLKSKAEQGFNTAKEKADKYRSNSSASSYSPGISRSASVSTANNTSSAAAASKGPPPPPPPIRSNPARSYSPATSSNLSSGAAPSPPPPPTLPQRRNTNTTTNNNNTAVPPVPPPSYPSSNGNSFSFTNISNDDKEAFFSLLDEYFEKKLALQDNNNNNQKRQQEQVQKAPPAPPLWARPDENTSPPPSNNNPFRQASNGNSSTVPVTTTPNSSSDLIMSYPSNHSLESAKQICQQIGQVNDTWYLQKGAMPPPLKTRRDYTFISSWSKLNSAVTLKGVALFSDLTYAWYTLEYDESSQSITGLSTSYTFRPKPLSHDLLYKGYESYSEGVAMFAEDAMNQHRSVGSGECWDLANLALKQFEQWPQIPKPVPSIERTHGHLIYFGKPGDGRWRGSDTQVRRGDIVEWRSVKKIRTVGMNSRSWCSLGDPDHTAIITAESLPTIAVSDGSVLEPKQLGPLQVIEQSAGKNPSQSTYDLSTMESGEIWIYRPISILTYLKFDLQVETPNDPDVRRFR